MGSTLRLIHGRVPAAFPAGVYYRNGPDLSDKLLAHPLDGQGRIDRLEFSSSSVKLLSRRVETPSVGRGCFGTGPQHGLAVHNPANTSVVHHAGRLMALWEGSRPIELDPHSLATLHEVPLGGAAAGLPASSGWSALDRLVGAGGHAVSAHPVRDPATGRLVVLSSQILPTAVRCRISELQPNTLAEERHRTFDVPGFTHVHGGLLVSKNLYVMFAPALALATADYLIGGRAMGACVSHKMASTKLHIIPRDHAGAARVATLPRCFVTHGINAYEMAGSLVVDAMVAAKLPPMCGPLAALPDVRVRRFIVDLNTLHVAERTMYPGPVELPAINPEVVGTRHRFLYGSVASGGWAKLDAATGRTRIVCCAKGPHMEPTFVPRVFGGEEEDAGWLLGFALVQGRPVLCIADAKSMTPCCVLDAPGANVLGIHGTFVHSEYNHEP